MLVHGGCDARKDLRQGVNEKQILRVVEWWKAKVIVDMAGCGECRF